jgi:hypothetical protein
MASKTDWLPSRQQDLVDLCWKWKEGLENPDNAAAFGWKQPERGEVLAAVDAYMTAYEAYTEENSTKKRLIKDEARTAAKRGMRDFANYFMRCNKLMNDGDRLVYGIRPAGWTQTAAGEPQSFPAAALDTAGIRQVKIRFWDHGTSRRGKPPGVHGAEIRWAILDHVPSSELELTNSDFSTASPFTLTFEESQRAHWVYFCLRWKTRTNLNGPFGEIHSAVIP